MFYVYKITNLVNGKVYIGKTNDIQGRWKEHIDYAHNSNRKSNRALHNAIYKYGIDNFSIEEIENVESEDWSFEREKYWIAEYKTNICKYGSQFGYNLTDGGEGSSGFKHSDETKQKMSEAHTGNKNHFYGKKHTESIKNILSEQKKSYYKSNKSYFIGQKHSEESKKKNSDSHLGMNIGEKCANSKLKTDQVIYIKILIKQKDKTNAEIGKLFGVTGECISNIRCGKTWKHV
jgi:group I intron endonuclease